MPFRQCAGEPNKPAILRARRNKLWERKVQRSTFSLLPPRSSTSPHTIRGSFTEIPSWRGRGGIRIPASGMTGLTFPGESVSRSVGSGVSDGAAVIGDSIGITDTQLMITTGTTPAAPPFTTGAVSIGEVARAAKASTVPETPGVHEDTRNPEGRAA